MPEADLLHTDLAGIPLRNPIVLAAGTAGVLDELDDLCPLDRLGAVTTKSLTIEPREGNPTWRMVPVGSGLMNAIGLANPGVAEFCAHVAPRIPDVQCPVIASVAGNTIDQYVQACARLDELGTLAAVELNVSCPNVHGGVDFGVDPRSLSELVRAVRPVLAGVRMLVKLSPVAVGAPGAADLARIAADPPGATTNAGPNDRPGADILVACNTIPAMAIDVRTRRPRIANVTGGLSGPPVHQVAVKIVHDVYRRVGAPTDTPIIGVGGVTRWQDAAEFILAGATAIGCGTVLYASPRAPLKIARGLEKWVRSQGCACVGDLVGAVAIS